MPKERKRRKAGKKKDPNRPKRAMSSFMFFANEKRAEVRAKFPELKITQVGKKLGEMWKDVTPEEKKRYEDMHTVDLARYRKAMETYVAPSESSEDSDSHSKKRRKKPKKDPNRPKRSMSSFMFFANEKRAETRTQHPDLKVTEIGKKLSELWKKLTPEEKKKYEDMHTVDKERYKKAMDKYSPPPIKKKAESSEESSSDESESD